MKSAEIAYLFELANEAAKALKITGCFQLKKDVLSVQKNPISHAIICLQEAWEETYKNYDNPNSQKYEILQHMLEQYYKKTQPKRPRTPLFIEKFEAQVQQHRTNKAIIYEIGHGLNRTIKESSKHQIKTIEWTYEQLDQEANLIARGLRDLKTQEKWPDGTYIGIFFRNCPEAIACILGVMKAKLAYIPITPDIKFPKERLFNCLKVGQAKLLLMQDNDGADDYITKCINYFRDQVKAEKNPLSMYFYNEMRALSLTLPEQQLTKTVLDPNQPAYIIFSSGTTGSPKGVVIAHRGLDNPVQAVTTIFNLTDTDCIGGHSMLSFDASVLDMMTALANGLPFVIVPHEIRQDADLLENYLAKHKVTIITLVPPILGLLTPTKLPNLRGIIATGEACPIDLFNKWQDQRILVNGYGPTETTICSNLSKYVSGQPLDLGSRCIKGITHLICKESKKDDPFPITPSLVTHPSEPGILYLSGENVGLGYIGNTNQGRKFRYVVDPHVPRVRLVYQTDDLFKVVNGKLCYFNRLEFAKFYGERVNSSEILEPIIDFKFNGIKLISDARLWIHHPGEVRQFIHVYIIVEKNVTLNQSIINHLHFYLRTVLNLVHVPSCYIAVKEWQTNGNDKVDLPQLVVKKGRRYYPLCQNHDNSDSNIAAEIRDIWHDILEIDQQYQIELDDNFVELGGVSMHVQQLVSRLEILYGADISKSIFYARPTIRNLIFQIKSQEKFHPFRWVKGRSTFKNDQCPTLLIHSASGMKTDYEHIIQQWPKNSPLLVTHSPTLNEPGYYAGSITQLASDYLEQLLTLPEFVKYTGPFYFVGYSAGGMLAYELTRQWQERGHFATVCGIDTTHPEYYRNLSQQEYAIANSGLIQSLFRLVASNLTITLPEINELAKFSKDRQLSIIWQAIATQLAEQHCVPDLYRQYLGIINHIQNQVESSLTYHVAKLQEGTARLLVFSETKREHGKNLGWPNDAGIKTIEISNSNHFDVIGNLSFVTNKLMPLLKPASSLEDIQLESARNELQELYEIICHYPSTQYQALLRFHEKIQLLLTIISKANYDHVLDAFTETMPFFRDDCSTELPLAFKFLAILCNVGLLKSVQEYLDLNKVIHILKMLKDYHQHDDRAIFHLTRYALNLFTSLKKLIKPSFDFIRLCQFAYECDNQHRFFREEVELLRHIAYQFSELGHYELSALYYIHALKKNNVDSEVINLKMELLYQPHYYLYTHLVNSVAKDSHHPNPIAYVKRIHSLAEVLLARRTRPSSIRAQHCYKFILEFLATHKLNYEQSAEVMNRLIAIEKNEKIEDLPDCVAAWNESYNKFHANITRYLENTNLITIKNIETITSTITNNIQTILSESIVAIEHKLGHPPCEYALLAINAYNEIDIYESLQLVVVWRDRSSSAKAETIHSYFTDLISTLKLNIISSIDPNYFHKIDKYQDVSDYIAECKKWHYPLHVREFNVLNINDCNVQSLSQLSVNKNIANKTLFVCRDSNDLAKEFAAKLSTLLENNRYYWKSTNRVQAYHCDNMQPIHLRKIANSFQAIIVKLHNEFSAENRQYVEFNGSLTTLNTFEKVRWLVSKLPRATSTLLNYTFCLVYKWHFTTQKIVVSNQEQSQMIFDINNNLEENCFSIIINAVYPFICEYVNNYFSSSTTSQDMEKVASDYLWKLAPYLCSIGDTSILDFAALCWSKTKIDFLLTALSVNTILYNPKHYQPRSSIKTIAEQDNRFRVSQQLSVIKDLTSNMENNVIELVESYANEINRNQLHRVFYFLAQELVKKYANKLKSLSNYNTQLAVYERSINNRITSIETYRTKIKDTAHSINLKHHKIQKLDRAIPVLYHVEEIQHYTPTRNQLSSILNSTYDTFSNSFIFNTRFLMYSPLLLLWPLALGGIFLSSIDPNYDLCLMNNDIVIEHGKLYLRERNNCIAYTVITPNGHTVHDIVIDSLRAPSPFSLEQLQKIKKQIVEATTKNKHTGRKSDDTIVIFTIMTACTLCVINWQTLSFYAKNNSNNIFSTISATFAFTILFYLTKVLISFWKPESIIYSDLKIDKVQKRHGFSLLLIKQYNNTIQLYRNMITLVKRADSVIAYWKDNGSWYREITEPSLLNKLTLLFGQKKSPYQLLPSESPHKLLINEVLDYIRIKQPQGSGYFFNEKLSNHNSSYQVKYQPFPGSDTIASVDFFVEKRLLPSTIHNVSLLNKEINNAHTTLNQNYNTRNRLIIDDPLLLCLLAEKDVVTKYNLKFNEIFLQHCGDFVLCYWIDNERLTFNNCEFSIHSCAELIKLFPTQAGKPVLVSNPDIVHKIAAFCNYIKKDHPDNNRRDGKWDDAATQSENKWCDEVLRPYSAIKERISLTKNGLTAKQQQTKLRLERYRESVHNLTGLLNPNEKQRTLDSDTANLIIKKHLGFLSVKRVESQAPEIISIPTYAEMEIATRNDKLPSLSN